MQRGLVILGVGLVIVAVALLGWCAVAVVQSQEAQGWTETQCTVSDAQLRASARVKKRSRRKLAVQYTYAIDGQQHHGDQWSVMQAALDTDADEGKALLETFHNGSTHPCWYDPSNVTRVVLDRSRPNAVYWLPLLSLMFAATGVRLLRQSRRAG